MKELTNFRGELIGKKLMITKSTNKNNIGIQGEITDETKWMLIVETNKGIKKIKKNENEFEIQNGEKFRINGKNLCYSPEERIKIKR